MQFMEAFCVAAVNNVEVAVEGAPVVIVADVLFDGRLAETKGFGAKVDFRFSDLISGDYVIEAITVDLVNTYEVNRIRIVWNNPAYATDYLVETSTDGEHFEVVIDRRDWNGAADDAQVTPAAARYVRVTGLHRATPYGTSIDELEVYAQAILPPDDAIPAVKAAASVAGRRGYDLLGRPVSASHRGLTITRGWKGVGGVEPEQ